MKTNQEKINEMKQAMLDNEDDQEYCKQIESKIEYLLMDEVSDLITAANIDPVKSIEAGLQALIEFGIQEIDDLYELGKNDLELDVTIELLSTALISIRNIRRK